MANTFWILNSHFKNGLNIHKARDDHDLCFLSLQNCHELEKMDLEECVQVNQQYGVTITLVSLDVSS